jgi:hypothetical protein
MLVETDRVMARNDINVKIDVRIYEQAKHVSVARKMPLAAYLSELLRDKVRADFELEVKKMLGDARDSDLEKLPRKPKGGK